MDVLTVHKSSKEERVSLSDSCFSSLLDDDSRPAVEFVL